MERESLNPMAKKQRINTPFVLMLVAALVLVVGGAGAFYFFAVYQDPIARAAEARESFDAGDYRLAMEELGKAVSDDPNNVELLNMLFEFYRDIPVDDYQKARTRLDEMRSVRRKISTLRINDPEAQLAQYQFLDQLRRELDPGFIDWIYQIADERLRSVQDDMIARKYRGLSTAVRMSRGIADQTQREQGRADLETYLEQNPDDAEALYGLASWMLIEAQRISRVASDDPEVTELRGEANEILARLLEASENDIDRRLDFVTLALVPETGMREQAQEVFGQIEGAMLEAIPSRRAVQSALAILDRGRSGGPTVTDVDPSGDRQTAVLADQERALRLAQRAVEAMPNDASLRLRLLMLYRASGQPEIAVATAEEVRRLTEAKAPPIPTLLSRNTRLMASLEMANGLFLLADRLPADQRPPILDRIGELAKELEITFPDLPQVTMLSGKLAYSKQDFRQAAILFDRASAQYGESNLEALLLSAKTRRLQKQWGAAADRLESILASRPSFTEARQELVEVYLAEQKPDEARRHIEDLMARNPGDAFANNAMAQLIIRHGTDAEKQQILEGLKTSAQAADGSIGLLGARLLRDLNRDDEAEQVLREMLQEDPGNAQVLAQVMRYIEDPAEKLALIEAAEAAGADAQATGLLRTLAEGGDISEALTEVFQQQATPLALAIGKARAAIRSRDFAAAQSAIDEAAAINPDDNTIVELRFDLAMVQQDWAQAEQVAELARQRNIDRVNGAFFRARVLAAQQEFEQAAIVLRQGLDIDRVNPESWTLLGEIYRRQGLLEQAADAIQQALAQRGNNLDALRLLAAIRNEQGRPIEALDALRQAYQIQPRNAEIRNLYLLYETQHGQRDLALAARERLADDEPNDYANKRALALMMAEEQRYDDAEAVVDRLLEDEGINLPNVATQANVLLQAERGDEGEAVIRRYIATRGAEVTAQDYLLLARYRLRSGNLPAAVQAYREGIAFEGENMTVSRELAALLFEQGESELSTALYMKLQSTFPDEEMLTLRLVESLLRANRLNEAREFLAQQDQATATTILLRSQLLLMEGDRDESLVLVNRALELNPDSVPALVRRANLIAFDDPEPAIRDLERALSIDATQTAARLLLSDIRRRSGDYAGSASELQVVLAREPNQTNAREKLIRLHMLTGETQQARAVVEEALVLNPENTLWHRLGAQIAARQQRSADAVQLLRDAVEIQPSSANVGALLGLMINNNRPDLALSLIDQHQDILAAEPTIQAIRGEALARTGSREAARRVFTRALERADSYDELNAIADRVQRSFDLPTAIDILVSNTQSTEPLWAQLAAARLETNDGRFADAVSRLRALEGSLEQKDQALRYQLLTLLGRALQLSGAYADARVAYEAVLEIVPSDLLTLNNLAFLLGNDLGEPQIALDYAQRAVNLAPQNPNTLDTLGWVQFKAGMPAEARRTLEQSLSFGRMPVNQYHLAVVLADLGSTAAARDLLEQAIRDAEASNDPETLEKARERLNALNQG